MQKTCLIRCLAIALACAASLTQLHADEMNDLMSTVMQASPEVKAKAQAYQRSSKKAFSSAKAPGVGKVATGVPNMQISDSEVLDVSAKFPKDYIGKYVYGTVYFGNNMTFPGEDVTSISFYAKNLRGFLLETKDEKVIQKLLTYQHGDKFFIPRECPLKIAQKCGFNYIVHLPFEAMNH